MRQGTKTRARLGVLSVLLLILGACSNGEETVAETPEPIAAEAPEETETEHVEEEYEEAPRPEPVEPASEEDDWPYDIGVGYGEVDLSTWETSSDAVGFENILLPNYGELQVIQSTTEPPRANILINDATVSPAEFFRGLQQQLHAMGYIVLDVDDNNVIETENGIGVVALMAHAEGVTENPEAGDGELPYFYCEGYYMFISTSGPENSAASLDYSNNVGVDFMGC